MRRYRNVKYLNVHHLEAFHVLDIIKHDLRDVYINLSGDNLNIIADLMLRYDKDVYEYNGQFSCNPQSLT